MRLTPALAASLLTLGSLLAATAQADSFASSAVGASSKSVGSVSDSLTGASNASSGGKHAAGRYRVTDVADAGGDTLRLTLQPEGDARPDAALQLTLPREALAARTVATGDVVQATPRPYGTEFAYADTRAAFFLVLEDDWHRELTARPVTL
jgi:hypothetical protein